MKHYLSKANKSLTVGWAAIFLSASYALSTALGMLRTRLIATNFGDVNGVGPDTDAYLAAFKFPDFMFVLIVSGALSVTLIPVFNQRYQTGNKKSAWEIVNSLLNLMLILTSLAGVLMIIFAETIIANITPALNPQAQADSVAMMRLFALSPIIFSISNIFVSVQQAVGRFFFFALAPITYNLGIIFGIKILGPNFGIFGAAIGVLMGAILQLIVSMLGMRGLGYKYQRNIFWKNLGFRKVLKLLPPRSFDQSMDFSLSIIETSIAGRLYQGAITAYDYANALHFVPVTLIGSSISTAAFPKMGERIRQGRPDLFKKEIREVFRVVSLIVLPVAMFTFLARGYVVRLQLGVGNQDVSDILAILSIAIIARTFFFVISKAFYANQDTKTPLFISVFAIIFNLSLAYYLAIAKDIGLTGLAIAQSTTVVLEVITLFIVFHIKYQRFLTVRFLVSITKILVATAFMGAITYYMIRAVPLKATDAGFSVLLPKITVIFVVSFLSYISFAKLLRIQEIDLLFNKIHSIINKPIK